MRKSGKMRNHLFQRGKKKKIWYAKIFTNGKQKTIKIGEMTRYDADKLLRAEITRRERTIYQDIQKITFEKLAQQWLENHKLDKKQNTVLSYSYQVNTHLIPFFGNLIVSKIKPEDIEKFKQETIQRVSPTTVNYDLRIFKSIMDAGIRWGFLFENPSRFVKRMRQQKRQCKILSKVDVRSLFEAGVGQGKVLLMAASMTGMRMGEILAMRWDNLDLDRGVYEIDESFSADEVDSPKTESSHRLVEFPEKLIEALRQHKAEQEQRRLKMNGKYQDNGLVFATELGTLINPSNLRNRIFYPARKKANLPDNVRFHDLRGAYATLALESGANVKFVQDQLGHKTARVTLEIYAKVNEATRKESTRKVQDHILGKPKPARIRFNRRRVKPNIRLTVPRLAHTLNLK